MLRSCYNFIVRIFIAAPPLTPAPTCCFYIIYYVGTIIPKCFWTAEGRALGEYILHVLQWHASSIAPAFVESVGCNPTESMIELISLCVCVLASVANS